MDSAGSFCKVNVSEHITDYKSQAPSPLSQSAYARQGFPEKSTGSKVGMGNEAWIFNFDSFQALSGRDLRGEENFPIQIKPIISDFQIAD